MSALFSVIGGINPDSKFLDLFAGTGRVGFEALRRGAASVVFVESVRDRAEAIRENLRDDSCLVLSLEIRRALSWLSKREMRFDYVFADPPYNSGWCEIFASLKNLDKILSDDCVIILEHSVREKFALDNKNNNNPYNLEILQEKIYGETCLTFLRKQIANQE